MKKLIILLTVLLVLGSACKKDFLSVDETNPNNASSVPANLVLSSALNNTSISINTPGNYAFIYEWYGCWCISGTYAQDANMTQYNLLNSHFQGNWSNSYTNLQNYDYIEKNSMDSKQSPYRAIAKIMKAFIFQNLVDCYGNVPYSKALQAATAVFKPAYDDQKDIYEKLVGTLDSAMYLIANLPVGAAEVGNYDIIFHGNMGKWAKFANTLKLRMLMNQSGMTGRAAYISASVATTSSGGFMGAGEGAWLNPGYLQTAGKMNPFWERFWNASGSQQADGLNYFAAGQDACDFLTTNNDPRKLRFFVPYSGNSVGGNYFGAKLLKTAANTSKIGPGMLQAYNQNAPILTDFESLFIQAEAAQKGFIPGSAKAFYEAAVTASILYEAQKASSDPVTYVPATSTDAVAYLAQASNTLVNFDAAPNKLQTIITQKWCALNGVSPLPIWTDYRRTGFPDFLHFTADLARKGPGNPPVRLLYPQTEISTNNDNVLLQGVSSTDDLFSKKIFWQNR
jgi:hypothetical protein